jgi:uncharacterized cupredoxin-like copper-binding protein
MTSTSETDRSPSADAELEQARQRWEAADSTRSTLMVTAVVLAGAAFVFSIVAIGLAWSHTPSKTAAPSSSQASAPAAPPSSQPAALAAFSAADIPVKLSEYKVALPSTTLTAGVKTLHITNDGAMQHELLVFHPSAPIDPNNLPTDNTGAISEDAPGVNKISDGDNINPGGAQTRTVDLTQPGTYVFVCNLPGHYKLGMRTIVTVAAPAEVPVALSEYKVALPSTTLTAGVKTLQITNDGAMEHELLVFHPSASIDPNNLPLDNTGAINEDAPGINKISDGDNIDPGGAQTRTVNLSQPGTYVFVCNLPGHYKLGMRTIVTVTAPPS